MPMVEDGCDGWIVRLSLVWSSVKFSIYVCIYIISVANPKLFYSDPDPTQLKNQHQKKKIFTNRYINATN